MYGSGTTDSDVADDDVMDAVGEGSSKADTSLDLKKRCMED